MEPEEPAIAWQQLGKHVPMTKNTHTKIEEMLGTVSSMQRVPRLYDKLKESRNLVFYDMFLRS
jgi:hypothetical protein